MRRNSRGIKFGNFQEKFYKNFRRGFRGISEKMPEYPEENQEKFKRNFRENSRGILEKNLFFFSREISVDKFQNNFRKNYIEILL